MASHVSSLGTDTDTFRLQRRYCRQTDRHQCRLCVGGQREFVGRPFPDDPRQLFTEGIVVPPGPAYQSVEGPRGELGCYIVSKGGSRPWRMHWRAPSFAAVQVLPAMMTDELVADIVATLASSDPVLGDVDR